MRPLLVYWHTNKTNLSLPRLSALLELAASDQFCSGDTRRKVNLTQFPSLPGANNVALLSCILPFRYTTSGEDQIIQSILSFKMFTEKMGLTGRRLFFS